MDRKVERSGKDTDGDITKLCGAFGSVSKATAISEIENRVNTYHVQQTGTNRVEVRVVTEGGKKYLRTTADSSSKNNLDNLPNC